MMSFISVTLTFNYFLSHCGGFKSEEQYDHVPAIFDLLNIGKAKDLAKKC